MKNQLLSSDLFAGIDQPPQKPGSIGEIVAKAQTDVTQKAVVVANALDAQQEELNEAQRLAELRLSQANVLRLRGVMQVWFPEKLAQVDSQVAARAEVELNIDAAAIYGLLSQDTVDQLLNTKGNIADARSKLVVAEILDQATGITRDVSSDNQVSAKSIDERIDQILTAGKNAEYVTKAFKKLFEKVANRVGDHQDRLTAVRNKLMKNLVTLDQTSVSLQTRKSFVLNSLYDTCIAGLALEAILEKEEKKLSQLIEARSRAAADLRPSWSQKIQAQENLIQIIVKRLVDLKGYAITMTAGHALIENARRNLGIVKSDVAFTSTNVIALLSLLLQQIIDQIATALIGKKSHDVRQAAAKAAVEVGASAKVLDEVANKALLDLESMFQGLNAVVDAALAGIQNTHDNMERVYAMNSQAEEGFAELFAKMSV